MDISLADAEAWDFVSYSKLLSTWNDREKVEEENVVETEPPSIEWMIADDVRTDALGHRVH